MKKLLILSIAIFTLFSCSDDDNLDPIIGEWAIAETLADDCEQQSRLTLNENGTYTFIGYYQDNDQNCMLDETFNGIWENNDNGTYTFNNTLGDDPTTLNINFSNNNNTFSFESDGDQQIYNRVN